MGVQERFNLFLLRKWLNQHRQKAIVMLQILFVVLGYFLAIGLRFEFRIPQDKVMPLAKALPLLLACRLTAYYIFKLNSGWWRFVSMTDLVNITKAVLAGSLAFLVGLVFIVSLQGYPRSVIILEAILNFVLLGGVRFVVRWFRETFTEPSPKRVKFVLVVGAGKAGAQLVNEFRVNKHLGIRLVGFVDDDPRKANAYIQGIKVLGTCEEIPELVREHDVDEIIVSIPCAGYKKVWSIVRMARRSGVEAKVLPSLESWMHTNGLWQHLRDIPLSELMNRPIMNFQRESDLNLLREEISGKSVLVTGAGGSIGSELVRQTAKLQPKSIILYERNETSLYFLELEMRAEYPECELIPVIGDLLNREKLDRIFEQEKVDLIYHAAAYKHVPMMERDPSEAVRNNVLATKVLAELAVTNGVAKCVYISTDKAVNPSSIMGATKRVGELVMQAYSNDRTKFITVRFGNVIGSDGSVLPLFKKQIARGGPITVTHPEASRYFMAISEAVQLVMTAGATGKGGEVFLLDMGKPIKIVDLATKLIKSYGLTPKKDIDIEYVGLRPGEKLHEELYWKGDHVVPTENKKITRLETNGFQKKTIISQTRRLERAHLDNDHRMLVTVLRELVPESKISNGANGSNGNERSSTQNSPDVPTQSYDCQVMDSKAEPKNVRGWKILFGNPTG